MLISTRTRADDVRALAGAIALGSSAGLVIGAAYLATGGAKPVPRQVPAASGPLQAKAAPVALLPSFKPQVLVAAADPQPGGASAQPDLRLRDRFRVAAQAFHAAAQPFRIQQVADAPSDLHCLTEAVYFEARGEAQAGQQAVAQVVLNRVRHPAFPKTICAVVHQHAGSSCQFSFACSSRQAAVNSVAWRRAESIAASEMHGAVMAAVGDATAFQGARASPFAGLLKVAQVGAHIFYRFGGHAGAPAMFRQTPAASGEPARVEIARLEPSAASQSAQQVSTGGRVRVTLYSGPVSPPPSSVTLETLAVKLAGALSVEAKPATQALHGVSTPIAIPPAKGADVPAGKPAVISVALAQS